MAQSPPGDMASDVDSHNLSEQAERDSDRGDVVDQGGSEDEGEDLNDNFANDYRAMPGLDQYETNDLDDEDEHDVTYEEAQEARLRADRELDRRDVREGRVTGRRQRLPEALEADLDEEDRRPTQRRRIDRAQAGTVDDDEDALPLHINLENPGGGSHRNFVMQEAVQKEIGGQFKAFLRDYQDANGDLIYYDRLRNMCTSNRQSIEVSFKELATVATNPAIWAVDFPRIILPIFDKAAKNLALEEFHELFENYEGGGEQNVFVRFNDLVFTDSLRDIRQIHLNKLISVEGVVTRRTGVFPQLQMVKYDCNKCGFILGPFTQNGETETKPTTCPQCQTKGGLEVNVQQTIYRNYQKLTLQESPGTVPAGRLPRNKEVILLNDLIDCARPGEQIKVVGIYSNTYDAALNVKNGFPVFSTVIEAVSVSKHEDQFEASKLTQEDRDDILALARDPRIGERIAKSIAPSIYGHGNIKLGLALALFGGQEKHPAGNHRLRGDINMLLLGDPGTAKSQFLKYLQKVAQRAVYTTGRGASAVGLTAAVQKDAVTKEWTLEGGALVLADKGMCLIDEFDKMNDQDRVSIHEAMEQQSISISKAGIVTSLQARCSVIAAANPTAGRYDSMRTFAENVELSDPILSRFDILCVVKDVVDPVLDERLAEFVVSSHMRAHPNASAELTGAAAAVDPDCLSQELLRKYVTFAKLNCHPKLQNADYDKIATVYTELRRESAISHGMPIAVRHLESIIRMAEAHARMHLRPLVDNDDVDTAIRVMLESFVSTQKQSVQKTLRKKFKHFIAYGRDFVGLLMDKLQALAREQTRIQQVQGAADGIVRISCRALEEQAREYDIQDMQPLFASGQFADAGFTLDANREHILRSY